MKVPQLLRFLAAIALTLPATLHAAAPTQFTTGAGEVRDFLAVSSTVGYAATIGGGLWKSTDSGANWSKTTLAAKRVWKISANPNSAGARLYAATDSGVFRSTDSGSSWTQLTLDPARAVAVSPGSAAGGPDTILVGVHGVGVLRSTDSGATFVRQSSGLDSTRVMGIVYPPGNANVAYAVLQCNLETLPAFSGNYGGAFRTINAADSTVTWSILNTGLRSPSGTSAPPCLTSIAANTSLAAPVVAIGELDPLTNFGTVWRITDASPFSWTKSSSDPLPYGIEWLGNDFGNSNGFFIGSHQFGPYRSTDGGVTLTNTLLNAGTDPDMASLTYATGAFTSTVFMTGIYGYGFFRTTTGASPWNLPTSPVRADRVNDLSNHASVAASTYYLALRNGSVMRSTDAGANWSPFNQGLQYFNVPGFNGGVADNFIRNVETIAAHPSNTSVAALGIRALGLYQLDVAANPDEWDLVSGYSSTSVDHKPMSVVITPAGKVFYSLFDQGASTPGGLHGSTATSTTIGTLASLGIPRISDANPGLGVAAGGYRVRPSPTSPQIRVFLLTFGAPPYRSMDGGVNWSRVTTAHSGFEGHHFLDIAEKANAPLTLVAATNKGVYRSTDDGASWSRVSVSGLEQTTLAAMVYAGTTGVLFGADFSGKLYCSTDDGTTWQAVTGGNLGATVRDMKYLNGAVHILTDGAGFFKKDSVCP